MDACLLVLIHEALGSVIPVDLEIPTYCSFDGTRAFNSALLEQGLKVEIGFLTLEEASLLLSNLERRPALGVSERYRTTSTSVALSFDLCVFRSHVQDQMSGYVLVMSKNFSS